MEQSLLYTGVIPKARFIMVYKNAEEEAPIGKMLEQAVDLALSLEKINERFNSYLTMEDYLPERYENTVDSIGNSLQNLSDKSKAAWDTLHQYAQDEKYGIAVCYVLHLLKVVQDKVTYDSEFCR